jgi:hypothetical protein
MGRKEKIKISRPVRNAIIDGTKYLLRGSNTHITLTEQALGKYPILTS